MEEEIIRKIISNIRNPINIKERIHFTSRSVLFLKKLFSGKRVDIIELHTLLLRIAYTCGCFDTSNRYINLRDLVVYLYSQTPSYISQSDIYHIANTFSTMKDSDYKEVEDMKIIVQSIDS